MKLHKLATLVFTLAAAGAVHAQSPRLMGSIPFDFVVHGKTLAAGDYTIDEDSWSHTLIVRRADSKAVAMALVMTNEPACPQEPARLVFHRYGDRYFLSQVWIPNKSHSTLSPTPIERELATKKNDPGELRLVALR